MKNYGFVNVASAIPSVKVADVDYNVAEIERLVEEANEQQVDLLVFPELSLTGYSCQDLFRQATLLDAVKAAIGRLYECAIHNQVVFVVGAPIEVDGTLYNAAIVFSPKNYPSAVVKTYLPNYGEFYERRWFASSEELPLEGRSSSYISLSDSSYMLNVYGGHLVFSLDDVKFGVEICEDVWSPIPPSSQLALQGADIILNLSATDELIGKHHYLKSLLSQQSARSLSGYVYSSCGFGESTQDVVYGGNAMIYENGRLLAEGERFSLEAQLVTAQIDVERLRAERRANMTFAASRRQTTSSRNEELVLEGFRNSHDIFSMNRIVDPHPFIPKTEDMQDSCEEIFNIQVMGLAKRLVHTHCQRVIVGISGGLDSTLALLVCVKTFDKLGFDRKGIVGVTMPGFGTTDRTHTNAVSLMQSLGVTLREVNISAAVMQHFADIGHDAQVHDVTYENWQARERTQILMDLSNQLGGLVIGTGALSELALG